MPFYYKSHGKVAPNSFVAFARRIYNPLGFKRGYNFPLWIIFGLGALAFCASRAMYLDYDGTYKDSKFVVGDWESQSHGLHRIGMLLHLAAVIPIGFLIPWQFLPIVRYKAILFHRINGYVLIALLLVGNAGGIIVSSRSMGGTLELRVLVAILAAITFVSILISFINIKRLQIDQHRAWMLRGWSYAFIIVSTRLIMLPLGEIVTRLGHFYIPMACHNIDHILTLIQPRLAEVFYPECANNPDARVAVLANSNPQPNEMGIPPLHEIAASVQITFPSSIVLSLLLHIFGVELYLHLTQYESNRLKRVSREKQIQRGWNRPGDASWLTKETWGDMEEFDYRDKSLPNTEDGIVQAGDSTSLSDSIVGPGQRKAGEKGGRVA